MMLVVMNMMSHVMVGYFFQEKRIFQKMITMILIEMTNHHDMYMIFYIVYMILYQMIKMKVTPVSLASLRTERLLPPPCNPKIQLYNEMI